MSFLDKVKSEFDKAKEGVSDFAETAKIRHEISLLNDRKADLLKQIGQHVYTLAGEGHATPEVEALCQQVAALDKDIKQKGEDIARVNVEHS
jgi:predicted  nucleic acid-binding Zn-ribbon protein